MDWSSILPAAGAAFAAALVEIVEAFTIVLAVATLRGWRPAILGTLASLALLAIAVLLLGPLLAKVPITALQLLIGTLLLLFGLGWLRKASLRMAGVIALHDEAAIFQKQRTGLEAKTRAHADTADWIAGLAAFKAVLLEGLEVVFIVIAVGAGNQTLWPASLGALAATVLVLLAGAFLREPLTKVPENTLKLGVGVMLSAFGVFWTGEGLGIDWPGRDLALPVFAALFLAAAWGAARLAQRQHKEQAE